MWLALASLLAALPSNRELFRGSCPPAMKCAHAGVARRIGILPKIEDWNKSLAQVVVVASPANTNALVLHYHAPSIPAHNITCLSRLDHNRTVAQVGPGLAGRQAWAVGGVFLAGWPEAVCWQPLLTDACGSWQAGP